MKVKLSEVIDSLDLQMMNLNIIIIKLMEKYLCQILEIMKT